MYCPQCGQQQAPGAVRFCSRCGFPLQDVMTLLGNGGVLPVYRDPETPQQMSARKKGVRQGALMFLIGVILVPILGVLAGYSNSSFPEILTALAALICFLGGLLRMFYAAVFEEGAPNPFHTPRPYVAAPMPTPQFAPPVRNAALPPPQAQPGLGWRQRPITAELANPPSVTEGTTRLLEKEDRPESK